MHISEGSEVATPPPPQGRQLSRRRTGGKRDLIAGYRCSRARDEGHRNGRGRPPSGRRGLRRRDRGLVGLVGGKGHRGHLVEFRAPVVGSEPHCFDRVVSHGELGLGVPRGRHGWPERATLFIVIIATSTRFQ